MICINSSFDIRYKTLTFLPVTGILKIILCGVSLWIHRFLDLSKNLRGKNCVFFSKWRFTYLQKSQTQIRTTGFSVVHVLLQKIYKQACKFNICFQQKENGINFHRTHLYNPTQNDMHCSFLWHSYTQPKIVCTYA